MLYVLDWLYIKKLIQHYNLFNSKIWRGSKLSKKKYLLLLIPVILIAVFIVVNYKPLSLAVEYYNTNYYNEDGTVNFDYTSKEIANNISNNNYQLLTGVIFEGAVADSNALAYVFITQQNCNQKEYYFEKFLYNPYRYLKKYI